MLKIELINTVYQVIKGELDGIYYVKEGASIDTYVATRNGNLVVEGRGSRKYNSYIKNLVELFIKQENELKEYDTIVKNILSWIVNAGVEVKNAYIEKNELFFIAYKNDKRIARFTVNINTMEIINYKGCDISLIDKFIKSWNKLTNINQDEIKNTSTDLNIKTESNISNNLITNMSKYCKTLNFNKDEYINFKNNIKNTALAIYSTLKDTQGVYLNINNIFNPANEHLYNKQIKYFIIQELKQFGVEFFKNNTFYRVA